MLGIGLQTTNGTLIMISVCLPTHVKNLLEESKLFHAMTTKLRLDSKDVESELVKKGTITLNSQVRATYALFQDIYVVTYFSAHNQNPFLANHYTQAAYNVVKQVVKNTELPAHPQIDKKFFEVNLALSKILDGVDVSLIDVSGPKFLDDLEKCFTEDTKIFRQAKVFGNETLIEASDLDDLGENVSSDFTDTNLLSEMKEFYANNGTANKNSNDVIGIFGESFSFESFTGELATPRTGSPLSK